MPFCEKDSSGYPYVVVSTDNPENTATYIYGTITGASSITWDDRPDLVAAGWQMPPVHIHYPVANCPPYQVRVKMYIICLVKKPD